MTTTTTFTMPKFTMPNKFTAPKFTAPTMDDAKSCWAAGPWLLVASWLGTGVLAIFVPVARWNNHRQEYYQTYGYAVEYEQAQRAYEEAQRDANDQGYYYPTCSWYDWGCRQAAYRYRQNNNNNNGDGNDQEQDTTVPNWYLFMGGQTEEGRRDMEEQGNFGTTPAIKFVYIWTLVMFCSILLYGAVAFVRDSRNITSSTSITASTGRLVWILFFFAQFLLLNMLLLAQGVIQTDGRDVEDSIFGWYGQTSVLMVYTDFWLMLHAIVFAIALAVRTCWLDRQQSRQEQQRLNDLGDDEAYVEIDAPKIEVTNAKFV